MLEKTVRFQTTTSHRNVYIMICTAQLNKYITSTCIYMSAVLLLHSNQVFWCKNMSFSKSDDYTGSVSMKADG